MKSDTEISIESLETVLPVKTNNIPKQI